MLQFEVDDPVTPIVHQFKCGHEHGGLLIESPELQTRRSSFWGLKGISEIRSVGGGLGTGVAHRRVVSENVLLHDSTFTTAQLLRDYIRELHHLIGDHGRIYETWEDGTHWDTLENCTFHGFTPVAFQGHERPMAIPDEAGITDGDWIAFGRLEWVQMVDATGSPTEPAEDLFSEEFSDIFK